MRTQIEACLLPIGWAFVNSMVVKLHDRLQVTNVVPLNEKHPVKSLLTYVYFRTAFWNIYWNWPRDGLFMPANVCTNEVWATRCLICLSRWQPVERQPLTRKYLNLNARTLETAVRWTAQGQVMCIPPRLSRHYMIQCSLFKKVCSKNMWRMLSKRLEQSLIIIYWLETSS